MSNTSQHHLKLFLLDQQVMWQKVVKKLCGQFDCECFIYDGKEPIDFYLEDIRPEIVILGNIDSKSVLIEELTKIDDLEKLFMPLRSILLLKDSNNLQCFETWSSLLNISGAQWGEKLVILDAPVRLETLQTYLK